MKKKIVVFLMMGLVVMLAFVAIASQTYASSREKSSITPFKVECITYPVVEFKGDHLIVTIPSDCTGTKLGNGEWYTEMFVDLSDQTPPFPQNGDMVFTAANGDQLFGSFFGLGKPHSATGNYYWGGYEINGGTGHFEGATGSGLYHGRADKGVGTAIFEGTLSLP